MDIILQENFPSLGYVGDKVAVRPGFARNFLIPRGIAVEASRHNMALLQHRLAGINARKARLKTEAEAIGARLAPVTLDFTLKMGSGGRSFGAITAKDIDGAIKAAGFALDRKQIKLAEPIRKPGEYQVGIKLHADVVVNVLARVVAEVAAPKPATEGESKPRKSRRKDDEAEAAPEGAEAPVAES